MAYKDTCPKCKAAGSMRVTSGIFMASGMTLTSDGFSFSDAKQVDTENEYVECVECRSRFKLTDLMTND